VALSSVEGVSSYHKDEGIELARETIQRYDSEIERQKKRLKRLEEMYLDIDTDDLSPQDVEDNRAEFKQKPSEIARAVREAHEQRTAYAAHVDENRITDAQIDKAVRYVEQIAAELKADGEIGPNRLNEVAKLLGIAIRA
jgi:predicted phage gp36 major capsid-like protein